MDQDWFKSNISCMTACPIETNAVEYIQAIAQGEYDLAFRIAGLPNPFVYSCGRICAHPCETACRRGSIDSPISIRALKRAASDMFMPTEEEASLRSNIPKTAAPVAIIGAGPAGLSCAQDLSLLGHPVTVFESTQHLGGMLRMGVPEYRLPRNVLNTDIHRILETGVKIEYGVHFGQDGYDLSWLRKQGFKAIFIAVGASKSSMLDLPGTNLDGVVSGIEFLLNVNLGYKAPLGKKVVVIGGGNVAFDVARTAIRTAGEKEEAGHDLRSAWDVARSALTLGSREVHLMCLESLEEMPADLIEIEEGTEEGIVLHNQRSPKCITGDKHVTGVETMLCTSVFDSEGNFHPTFDLTDHQFIEADNVVIAIGQRPDLSFIGEGEEPVVSPKGTIAVSPESMATSAPDVFCGGDAAFGSRFAVHAIADGRVAARSIHRYLGSGKAPTSSWNLGALGSFCRPTGYDTIERLEVPVIPTERRVGFAEVETGYLSEQAELEASRCLRCNLNPLIDAELCILCAGCVDICPYGCILMVDPTDCDLNDQQVAATVRQVYQLKDEVNLVELVRQGKLSGKFMLKNEDQCIRCSLCVERCPTGAMSMQSFRSEEVITLER